MNMILHNNPTALIKQGNTLANPLFTSDDGQLKTFDYVVAKARQLKQGMMHNLLTGRIRLI